MQSNQVELDPDNVRALHSALVSDRTSTDQLLWQAPVLSLTAQAFLLTIAFDGTKANFYRCVSGIIAMAIGLISWQLFVRHAAIEKRLCIMLEKFEKEHFGKTVHERPNGFEGISNCKSRPIWQWTLFFISMPGLFPLFEVIHNMCHK